MFTYSHANMPLGQSERMYYLSYCIKTNGKWLHCMPINHFSVMASGLLESTGDFLESELDQSCSDLHNNTDQSDDLRYVL